MIWKSVVLGSLSTLAVTIVGGLGVYYLTKENVPAPKENLVYEMTNLATFSGTKTNAGIISIRLANVGDLVANNVKLLVKFNSDIIEDKSVVMSSGNNTIFSYLIDQRDSLSLSLGTLIPNEELNLTILLAEPKFELPDVSVRSDNSLGSPGVVAAIKPIPRSLTQVWLGRVMGTVIPITLLLTLYAIFRLKRSLGRGSNLNNIAFVFLHQGMLSEAQLLLEKALRSGKDAPHSIANYALCLALQGRNEESDHYFMAARFYAKSSHEQAVVDFNSAIVASKSGDKIEWQNKLRDALSKSKSEIKQYFNFSCYTSIDDVDDPEIRKALA